MNKYDTFWPRFFALILDGFILNIFAFCFLLIPQADVKVLSVIQSLLISNVPYAYAIYMIGKYGQTFGKMALGIKVVDNGTEESIGFHQSFMREAVPFCLVNFSIIASTIVFDGVDLQVHELSGLEWVILSVPSLMLAIWGILEIVTMLGDEKNRALHDKIADTVVVKV